MVVGGRACYQRSWWRQSPEEHNIRGLNSGRVSMLLVDGWSLRDSTWDKCDVAPYTGIGQRVAGSITQR
jgi:hypothetical protein